MKEHPLKQVKNSSWLNLESWCAPRCVLLGELFILNWLKVSTVICLSASACDCHSHFQL